MSGAEDTSISPAGWLATGRAAAPASAPPRRRLFRKYALLFVALVGAALLVNSGFDFWFSYQENKAALVHVQQEKAQAAATRIEGFVGEIERQIGWTTHAQWASGPLDQRRQDYFRLLRQVPPITELTELDGEGREQLKVSRLSIDVVGSAADFSQSPAFIGAKANHLWFSPVYFRKQSEPYMTLAIAREGRNAGVTIAEINLKLIWDVIIGLKIGQGGYAYVVDRRGRLIAHPDISLVLRDTDLSKLPRVAVALKAGAEPGPPDPAHAVTVAKSLSGRRVLTAHAAIAPLGWRVFVEVPLAEAFAPLYGAALRTAGLLVFGLIAATLVALMLARRMTGPIHQLQEGAARIGAGDLARRIEIHTGDELEALAGQFNRMAGDLQQSYAELEQRVADRTAELSEALDQQTATAEVLGVINSSPGDLAPVFDAILEKAMRLCEASFGFLLSYSAGEFQFAAGRGIPGELATSLGRLKFWPRGADTHSKILNGASFVEIPDLKNDEPYRAGNAGRVAIVDIGGARTALVVPLRKDDAVLGTITAYRQEVRPFTDKQIALLQNFAAQAVIAMENARLITETREALEQQTATAEVLGVINSSPGDLAPVFDAILEKAHSLCGAPRGALFLNDGGIFRAVATRGLPQALTDRLRQGTRGADMPTSAPLLAGKPFAHILDAAEFDHPILRAGVELAGNRTLLAVPLRSRDAVLGMIVAARPEVRPFSDKQIALLQNFAAQAVIAMENARLITETREALEQQTATAEILGVINSSPGNLVPVFDELLDKAMALCEAVYGQIATYDGRFFQFVAVKGAPLLVEQHPREPLLPEAGITWPKLVEGHPFVHMPDLADTDLYRSGHEAARAMVDFGGCRTMLTVALRRDEVLVGGLTVYRQDARPFSEKQIALLQNFAAQAVIAMENARLITETREALAQQTATAEVLGVINASPGDLAPVFDAMLEKAIRLCGATHGTLRIYDGDAFQLAVARGEQAYINSAWQFATIRPGGAGSLYTGFLDGAEILHLGDALSSEQYKSNAAVRQAFDDAGIRSWLGVALRKDAKLLGVIAILRRELRPFTEKQIALLQNFAAQAVIAMENARLITETREALEQQTATAEVLQVINSSPGDLAPVFDAILEKAHSLCGIAFGSLQLKENGKFRAVAVRGVATSLAELLRQPLGPLPGAPQTRLLAGERFVQIPDVIEAARQLTDDPRAQAAVAHGLRTVLFVPLRKDDGLLGYIAAFRKEVRPFSDKQIALLQNFAAQAVIAMENARLITETREALEQQTATAEVLQIINASPGDLAPVFDAMLEKATSLCEAAYGILWTYDGERYQAAALLGVPRRYAEFLRDPQQPGPLSALGRVALGELVAQIEDITAEEIWRSDDPMVRQGFELGGFRTVLAVPLRKDEALLGAFTIYRQEVRPFSDKQMTLLQNFAAQAVIAMENARLITETRERTRDLQESLEYQTATSDVLKVISQSTFDLTPVLDFVCETAVRLCGVQWGNIWRLDGGAYRWESGYGVEGPYLQLQREARIAPGRETLVGRVALTRDVVHILDGTLDPEYEAKDDLRLVGCHTMLGVPLLREGAVIGVICMGKTSIEAVTDKQIELVRTFADQAVIAIENARLLNELRSRTDDLQESLDYQTATSDVLKVISQSTFDLEPVLRTVVETAVRMCNADKGAISLLGPDGLYRPTAPVGMGREYEEVIAHAAWAPDRGTLTGRVALEGRVVQIGDALTDPELVPETIQAGGIRTFLGVPLLRGEQVIGVLGVARGRVEPFTDKQIALFQTFADQAVIAIENARLLNELRERTDELGQSVEELKALSEVGQAVSSTLDLGAVLTTILERSVSLTGSDAGAIFRYSRAERTFRYARSVGWDWPMVREVREISVAETATALGEAVAGRAPLQIPDLRTRPSNPLRDSALGAGLHSALIVPLIGPERMLGVIVLQRCAVGEFPDATVRLMQTLASQSVMAIQNARLFREIAEKSEQLAEASRHKSQFLANMSHELRTPLNAILGYTELMADGIYGELAPRAAGVLERVQNNGRHLLALINDVLDLAKIEAGQLTLTLEDYAMPDVVQSVLSATEGLANTKGLKFTADIMPGLPMGRGDARRLSQVLLNLTGNAIKFTDAGEVAIGATAEDGHFVLTVRDTGPGIAPEDQAKIFEEFQQVDNSNTRKKGGTGLGLAISKRMVEMQGGTITVASELGHGATFRVTLPVRVEDVAEELMGAA